MTQPTLISTREWNTARSNTMLTHTSNSPTLPPVTNTPADNKIPVITTHHHQLEYSQLDKQERILAPNGHDLYETVLPPWRAAARARILTFVERESQILARMQARLVYHLHLSVCFTTFYRNISDTRGWMPTSSIVRLQAHKRSS